MHTPPGKRKLPLPTGCKTEALISDCGTYRYYLERRWNDAPEDYPAMTFIMLNPSTADAHSDDPTIRKCRGIAERNRFYRLIVLNLFAYRSAYPEDLCHVPDPIGPDSNRRIANTTRLNAGPIVLAWGSGVPKKLLHRADEVVQALKDQGKGQRLYTLGISQSGFPKHPLFLPMLTSLQPYEARS